MVDSEVIDIEGDISFQGTWIRIGLVIEFKLVVAQLFPFYHFQMQMQWICSNFRHFVFAPSIFLVEKLGLELVKFLANFFKGCFNPEVDQHLTVLGW